MPQHAKGPRLYRRKDTGMWIIRDTGRGDRSTGSRDRKDAERSLTLYLAERDRPRGPATASEMTVAETLITYAKEHAPSVSERHEAVFALAHGLIIRAPEVQILLGYPRIQRLSEKSLSLSLCLASF